MLKQVQNEANMANQTIEMEPKADPKRSNLSKNDTEIRQGIVNNIPWGTRSKTLGKRKKETRILNLLDDFLNHFSNTRLIKYLAVRSRKRYAQRVSTFTRTGSNNSYEQNTNTGSKIV